MISYLVLAATAFAGMPPVAPHQDTGEAYAVREGWIVIDVDNQLDLDERVTLEAAEGVEFITQTSDYNPSHMYVGWSDNVTASIAELRSYAEVQSVEERFEYTILGEMVSSSTVGTQGANDPDYGKQWHMKAASSDYVWSETDAGKGIVVAILDTGFQITKDFNPEQVLPGKSFTGEPLLDRHGHGSHCAATVAQWTDNKFAVAGLAKNAKILPVKVLSNSGSGYSDWIADGIDWAEANGADVISMSLGSPQEAQVISRAIDRAIAKGVVVVAAAGNSGGPHNHYPSGYPPVISIGSTGPDGVRAPYSSYGKGLDIMAPGGNKQIPGGGVFQWINFQGESLQEWQGTSMATPHAAAATAVLLAEGVEPARIEAILKKTATPPPSGKSAEYGAGTINLEKAVKAAHGEVMTSNNPAPGGPLPYPSKAGSLTMVISVLASIVVLVLGRVCEFRKPVLAATLLVAALTSGPLYGLTYLPIDIPGLSVFMVHWLEIPDYLVGAGASGNPVWLSFLPLVLPFIVLSAFPQTRPIIIGLLVSAFAYLGVNTFVHFNPVWWMTGFGSNCWLAISTMCVAAMLFTASEWEHIQSAGRKA